MSFSTMKKSTLKEFSEFDLMAPPRERRGPRKDPKDLHSPAMSRAAASGPKRTISSNEELPPKPAPPPGQCAIFNQTTREWEFRPKSQNAGKRFAPSFPPSNEAARLKEGIPLPSSSSSSSEDELEVFGVLPVRKRRNQNSSDGPAIPVRPRKAKSPPAIFRSRAGIQKPASTTPRGSFAAASSSTNTYTRPRPLLEVEELKRRQTSLQQELESVDAGLRLLEAAQRQEDVVAQRETMTYQLAKTLTKRDACSKSSKGGVWYMGRR
ncbi:uncharacterized protein HMPREF1541_06324 [Cyphellophora europaea CBS 101466]|uniref:Uncharacterized protein n=1 Tax=Cyphellophora europaea (strain CBS 101466) TaxID=1220924 RepID=W2RRE4_CYPE1|nr:uncharacterized protein HMPREF1541_06324 [Cyphellophora europaea CBS 101466]ETN38293.1 hypothetical protein HMPREF1541_06324 [Cyphellophora europaea CBS 101466]